jgi:hypothetical protein
MSTSSSFWLGLCLAIACAFPATARSANNAPLYDSSFDANRPASLGYNTPEDDARPGEKFFYRGAFAFRHKQYKFAVDMYKVAASWAYKPAEYNLGVMYLHGQGIAVDLPRAMAWFALAAERGNKDYVAARELLYAHLSKEQFAQANVVWRELKPTFGDEVALSRAKARWADVRNNVTGSHVGSIGNVQVGAPSSFSSPRENDPSGAGMPAHVNTTTFEILSGGCVDASIAYRQLHESNNPYDPKFEWHTSPDPKGTATVGPLIPVDAKGGNNAAPAGIVNPQQPRFY